MPEPETEDETIGELLTRLADDAKAFGQAELDYYKTLVRERLRAGRTSLWMGGVALSLGLAAGVALVVGLVLTLAPLVGPGFATLIVVAVTLGLASLMGYLAWQQIKKVLGNKP
jgi:cell division protein FtsX